jgi:hypothetical protein
MVMYPHDQLTDKWSLVACLVVIYIYIYGIASIDISMHLYIYGTASKRYGILSSLLEILGNRKPLYICILICSIMMHASESKS